MSRRIVILIEIARWLAILALLAGPLAHGCLWTVTR